MIKFKSTKKYTYEDLKNHEGILFSTEGDENYYGLVYSNGDYFYIGDSCIDKPDSSWERELLVKTDRTLKSVMLGIKDFAIETFATGKDTRNMIIYIGGKLSYKKSRNPSKIAAKIGIRFLEEDDEIEFNFGISQNTGF